MKLFYIALLSLLGLSSGYSLAILQNTTLFQIESTLTSTYTSTPTLTQSPTPTATFTNTPTQTNTSTPTETATSTAILSPTYTPTQESAISLATNTSGGFPQLVNGVPPFIPALCPPILFYLALLFGIVYLSVAAYRVGRLGMAQIAYFLAASPLPAGDTKDIIKVAGELGGVPTSLNDVLNLFNPLAWLTSLFPSLYASTYAILGKPYAYFAQLFGEPLGRIWFFIGIPILILYLITILLGYNYWPEWVVNNEWGIVLLMLSVPIIAYEIGKTKGSPQRTYNRARQIVEGVIASKGYWFDHYINHTDYLNPKLKSRLEEAHEIYDEILVDCERQQDADDLSRHKLMTLHYQRALLFCALGDYSSAKLALDQAKKHKTLLKDSSIWEYGEAQELESQILFLEGELMFVQGQISKAQELFESSLEIDTSRGDSAGIEINNRRIDLVKENIKL